MASSNRETRRVTVVFGSETSEAEGGFKKVRGEAEKTHGVTGKLSEMFNKLGPGILASIGAESVGVAFTKVIGGASDLNETVSKTRQVFKTTGDSVLQWSDTSASAMGISKRAALENVSAFGNIYEQMGLTEKTAETMSKRMVTLASDFASFANAEPADVMDALQSATRGEYDALQRYVPTVNAAAVQTEALSETHKKTASSLSSAENATALYNLVLKNAGAAVGDFGRTSNSAANQQRILSASLEDAAAKIGNFILPAYQALLGIVTHIGPINLAIAGLGIAFGTKITAGVTAARSGLVTWIATMRTAAAEAMVTTGATSRLGGALAVTGATARAAGTRIGAMSAATGVISKLSAVFLIGQAAAYLFGKEVNIQVSKLSDSLSTFAKTGELSGEALKALGDNSKYAQSLANYISQADTAVGKFGRVMESFTGAKGFDTSIENTEKRVKAIDGALTQLATSGHMDEAKASFDKLAATFIAHGASMEQVRAKFSNFTAELDRVNDAQKATAQFAGGDLTTVFKNLSPVFNGSVTDAKLFETALGSVGKAGEDTDTKLAEYGTILSAVGGSQVTTAEKAKTFKDGLSAIEDSAGTTAEKGRTLAGVFNSIGDAQLNAKQKGDLLKATLDALHGAAMSQIEAEESQFTSTTALSDAFKKNGTALDLNSAKTAKQRERVLANRDALEAALTATRDKYVADITAGVNADTARGKYDKATKAILNQIDPTDRNKKSVQNLVSAYGGIPPAKKTNIYLDGDKPALDAMVKSFALQKALSSNWTKAKADDYYTQLYRKYVIPNFIGPVAPRQLSSGGAVGGWSPHKRADNIPALLTAREWVHPVDAVDYYGENTMEAIRTKSIPADLLQAAARGVVPDMFGHPKGYASGGSISGGPVWNFPIRENILNPANLSSLQKQFAAMIASGLGDARPYGAGKGWQWELDTLHKQFGGFGVYATTGGRHATNSWHYKGRAVDIEPIRQMAEWISSNYGKSTLELISPWTSLNIKNGHSYAYSRAIQAEHGAFGNNAHIHWAYDQGGMLPPGTTVAHNNTGRPEYVLTEDQMSGANVTVNVTVQGNVTTERQLAESIATSVRDALLRKAARNGGRTGLT